MILSYKIQTSEVGLFLDQFLTEKYTYYSLENWAKQIANKKICVNEQYAKREYVLNKGDEIIFLIDGFEEPIVDSIFSVVYEDEFIFAINKSGNLPVHPAGRYRRNNLTTILAQSNIISSEKYIVNRLDRETSGIVLFGKSTEAAARMSKLFERTKIEKTYFCYVEGEFPKYLSAKGFLFGDESSKIRKKKKFSYEKNCLSHWEVSTDFELIQISNNISKIFAYPHTGKIHQIRATLFSLGYPVVGDKIYGYDENLFLQFIETGHIENKFQITRQALHAYSLEFLHPFTGKQTVIKAEEPEDMKGIFMCKV